LLVEFGETVEELSIQESALNAENAKANSAASHMDQFFMKSQSRNKRASRTEGIIRLLLIILWALVVVVVGFYSGLAYHHH
jgi:hypothetical protein